MQGVRIKQILRTWMLPIAMLGGILFHGIMGYLEPVSPYLIAVMLFITYCKLGIRDLRLSHLSLYLLLVQLGLSITLYVIFRNINENVAQTLFICVFCPTATAAPVITGFLGGNVSRLAAFSLVSNMAVAVLAPFLFSMIGADASSTSMPLMQVTLTISLKVVPLIIGPLVLALMLDFISPRAHMAVAGHQSISFYVWAVSLFIVVGNAVTYVINHLHTNPNEGTTMMWLALASLIVCCTQFFVGRKIGALCGDKIAGAQGLGQKNTVLAIWMSLTFLNPIVSVGPAAYVAWQNTINSLQIWHKNRHQSA